MQIVLVTGLSGSGKSIAIRQLEDCGYYCIDNLPAHFLVPVLRDLHAGGTNMAAVAIDARSHATFEGIRNGIETLRAEGHDVRVLFLTASTAELVQRFSETRRRHPLTTRLRQNGREATLQEAIERERDILGEAAVMGHVLDTTGILPNVLRCWVLQFVNLASAPLTLSFESFAFKHGLPVAADLVFDVRCLPNPYYDESLRPLTGKDEPVATFLAAQPDVVRMIDDIEGFVRRWLPAYRAQNRHYLTVAIGCTGGQHRSVFTAETLCRHFAADGALVRHRALESYGLSRTQTR